MKRAAVPQSRRALIFNSRMHAYTYPASVIVSTFMTFSQVSRVLTTAAPFFTFHFALEREGERQSEHKHAHFSEQSFSLLVWALILFLGTLSFGTLEKYLKSICSSAVQFNWSLMINTLSCLTVDPSKLFFFLQYKKIIFSNKIFE